jgi:hypothetical protein
MLSRSSAAAIVVGLMFLCLGSAVSAQSVTSFQVTRVTNSYSAERGGTAGTPFNLSCPDGRVLVGVQARAGLVVDRIQGICRPVTGAGAWTGSESTTVAAGGNGGSAVTRRCPANYAVSGFAGRQGQVLDQIALECTRLSAGDAFDTSQRTLLPAFGGSLGTAFSVTRCARPGRALTGRSGWYIDAMRLVCEGGATPLMTLAQVDAALQAGNALLQTDADGRLAEDVACNVAMRASGNLRIAPSLGLWAIDDFDELDRALSMGGPVIVNAINYCAGIGANIVGCARRSASPQLVVVPFLNAQAAHRGTLWAHEFGHTRGLPHRESNSGNLMFPSVNTGGLINGSECSAFGG